MERELKKHFCMCDQFLSASDSSSLFVWWVRDEVLLPIAGVLLFWLLQDCTFVESALSSTQFSGLQAKKHCNVFLISFWRVSHWRYWLLSAQCPLFVLQCWFELHTHLSFTGDLRNHTLFICLLSSKGNGWNSSHVQHVFSTWLVDITHSIPQMFAKTFHNFSLGANRWCLTAI